VTSQLPKDVNYYVLLIRHIVSNHRKGVECFFILVALTAFFILNFVFFCQGALNALFAFFYLNAFLSLLRKQTLCF